MLLALRPNYPPNPVFDADAAVATDVATLLGVADADAASAVEAIISLALSGASDAAQAVDAAILLAIQANGDAATAADVVLLVAALITDADSASASDAVSTLTKIAPPPGVASFAWNPPRRNLP